MSTLLTKPLDISSVEIDVTESLTLKNASACLRQGVIQVRLPKRWPAKEKSTAVQTLVNKVLTREQKNHSLLSSLLREAGGRHLTFSSHTELAEYVFQLNRDTVNVPLKQVRLGRSRYSHLAQVNLKTRVMTVSRFCTRNVPEAAFRYLILHELCHFLEASHNRRFWSLVRQHVPDYPTQSRLIKAFHQLAVQQA